MAVETVVIRITQDTRELVKTIDQLERLGVVDKENAASFRANANEFQKEQGENQQAVRKTNKQLQNTGKTVGALDNQFRNLAATVAAAFTVQQIIQFTKSVVQVRGEVENTQIAFENMLGSASKASALLKDLQDFGAITPFNIQEVERGAQALLVAGENSKNVIPTLERLGNAASGTNTNFQELVEVYGIFKVQNEILTQDLRQLTARGIPILQELAKSFNITTDAVFDFASEGKIKFKDIEQAFINMSEEGGRFHNLMQLQSETTGGQISNLEDEITAFKRELGEELAPTIRQVVANLRNFVRNINPKDVIKFTKFLLLGVQALVSYKATMKAAALATNAFTAAKASANAVLAGASGFLGRLARLVPVVGGVVSVLGLAATATRLFRNNTKKATTEQKNFKKATDDVTRSLRKQKEVMSDMAGSSLEDLLEQEARIVEELEKVNDATFKNTIRTDEFAKARERLGKAGVQSVLEFDEQNRPILKRVEGEALEDVPLPGEITDEEIEKAKKEGIKKLTDALVAIRAAIVKKRKELALDDDDGDKDKKDPFLEEALGITDAFADLVKGVKFFKEADDAALQVAKLNNRERLTDAEDIRRADIQSEIDFLQAKVDANEVSADEIIAAQIAIYDKKRELEQMDLAKTKETNEKLKTEAEILAQEQIAIVQRRTDAVISITEALTDFAIASEEERLEAFKQFAKQTLLIILKELQATLLAEQFKIVATSLARSTFDPTAALGAAKKIGLITAAFAAAQTAISAITFHDGTDYVPGGGGAGLRSDETWAKLQQGEGVVRQSMNSKYSGLVKAMNEDSVGSWFASNPKISNRVLKDMRQEILAQNIAHSMTGGEFSDAGINRNLKKGMKADRTNTEYLAKVIKQSLNQNPWGVGS